MTGVLHMFPIHTAPELWSKALLILVQSVLLRAYEYELYFFCTAFQSMPKDNIDR